MEIIGDNYLLPKSRLKKLTEYLYEYKDVLHDYDSIIEYQKQKKIIERHQKIILAEKCCYLPHHPVIRPEKLTTKIENGFSSKFEKWRSKIIKLMFTPRTIVECSVVWCFVEV